MTVYEQRFYEAATRYFNRQSSAEQRRFEAALGMLQTLTLAEGIFETGAGIANKACKVNTAQERIKVAIEYADALIAELNKTAKAEKGGAE